MPSSSTFPEGISVVICCYNSARRLPTTLQHLAAQLFTEAFTWELIVVNNASTDETEEVARTHWEKLGSPAPIRLISEPRPGTDHARRAGVYAAAYSCILFCDDDNWLAPDYMEKAFRFLQERPSAALVGGQAEPVADMPLPEWFHSVSPYYAASAPAPRSMRMTEKGIWSAGMMGRTERLRIALDPALPMLNAGRIGNGAGFGEDGEICMRIILQNQDIYYFDQLKLKHYMAAERLTETYRDKLLAQSAEPGAVVTAYFRMYYFQKQKSGQKLLRGAIHFVKYCRALLTGKRDEVDYFRDYLYYLMPVKMFETTRNKHVRHYLNYLRSGGKK